jgi:KUP system potassium uptake protein
MDVREIAPRVWQVHIHFGFMEQPDIPALLKRAQATGYPVDPSDVTYFIGRVTVVPREDGKGLPRLVRSIFTFLLRNSSDAIEYFRLPREQFRHLGQLAAENADAGQQIGKHAVRATG